MLVGGISCRSGHAEEIHQRVAQIRSRNLHGDSLQWKHFRPEKFAAYKELIDYFIEENSAQKIDYSCIVIDRSALNHTRFNEGDAEAFFQKVCYQIAVSITRKYSYPRSIRIFHGARDSGFDLNEISRIMNAGLSLERHETIYRPIKQFSYMDVGISGPHQIADTLLGATSYFWNRPQQRNGKSRKKMLADYINSECCANFLGARTPASMPHFDIWPFRLR